jgi:polyisoprenoid-binding protein YceI
MSTTATEQRTVSRTRLTVDSEQSGVEFAVKTFWGLATVHGRFDRFGGYYETGADGATIELTIDADRIDTGNATRDRHLRSDRFFHVAAHPEVRFISTRVHNVGSGVLHVVGRLEAGGRSVLLEFPAIISPAGGGGLEIEATTTVDQRELGMSDGTLGMIRRPATLHVRARLSGSNRSEA